MMMKMFLGILVLSFVGSSVANPLFHKFMDDYDISYSSDQEYQKRLSIFRQNLQRIEAHNSGNHGWTMKMNQFGDLTVQEFASKYKRGSILKKTGFAYAPSVDMSGLSTIPDTVDWRTQNAVTPVKNQGQCGSCWSFSTTGAIEGAVAIKNSSPAVSLSEQQLVDCGAPEGNAGCNGGLMDFGFQYVIDAGGLCSESAYPYVAATQTCEAAKCARVSSISGYHDVTRDSPSALKAAIAQQPISVAVEADSFTWQFYHSGVYTWPWCGTSLDHGVLAIGYGTQDGDDYFLVKNSWGASWGDNGYIKIKASYSDASSKGECGICMQPSYPIAI